MAAATKISSLALQQAYLPAQQQQQQLMLLLQEN
jgi:hypothetical protein